MSKGLQSQKKCIFGTIGARFLKKILNWVTYPKVFLITPSREIALEVNNKVALADFVFVHGYG